MRRLVGRLGPRILKTAVLFTDRAYGSKANVEDFAGASITVINSKNKRKAKKVKGKYRLQDYCKVHGKRLNHLYKKDRLRGHQPSLKRAPLLGRRENNRDTKKPSKSRIGNHGKTNLSAVPAKTRSRPRTTIIN